MAVTAALAVACVVSVVFVYGYVDTATLVSGGFVVTALVSLTLGPSAHTHRRTWTPLHRRVVAGVGVALIAAGLLAFSVALV